MDISYIAFQPNDGDILASYRPIYFGVIADILVDSTQPMYCDIYFNNIFYKTISSTTIKNFGGTNSYFEFDIQDAAQEAIKTNVPSILLLDIFNATLDNPIFQNTNCFCRFRGSTLVSGILIPNPVVPIQGTSTTQPISGTGTQSSDFQILNATLFPDFNLDTINLNLLEDELVEKTLFSGLLIDTRIYPLSNLPKNDFLVANTNLCPEVYSTDYGSFPIYILRFGTFFGFDINHRNCQLYFEYFENGLVATGAVALTGIEDLSVNNVYYLPLGLANIFYLIPSIKPTILNPNSNFYYRLVLLDTDSNHRCFISPMYKVRNTGIEEKRIWFQNAYGCFEQVSFARNEEVHKTSSTEQFTPYLVNSNNNSNDYLQTGRKRFNIRGQDEISLVGLFREELMDWLKELLRSGICYLETQSDFFGSPFPCLRECKIIDGSIETYKTVNKAGKFYETTFKVIPSLDYITLRN